MTMRLRPAIILAAALCTLGTMVPAQSLPTTLSALQDRGGEATSAEAVAFRDEWTFSIHSATLNVESGLVRWPSMVDGKILVADARLLMMASEDGDIVWGWAIDTPVLPLSSALDVLRAHGQANGIAELTTPQLNGIGRGASRRLPKIATLVDGIEGVAAFHQRGFDDMIVVTWGTPRLIEGSL